MSYTKPIGKALTFYECLQLLSKLKECNMLMQDPDDPNHVLVYRKANGNNPEGWYSENIFDTAQDLLNDAEGQKFLMQELTNKNITMEFKPANFRLFN